MNTDPKEDLMLALLVATVPDTYGQRHLRQLFERGFEHRSTDGDLDTERMIEHVEQTGLAAWKPAVRSGQANCPIVDDPGEAATDVTMAALSITNHPDLETNPTGKLTGVENLCELYTETILELVQRYDDRTLEQNIAEVVYSKSTDDTPHPGRVCTAVSSVDAFEDDHLYVEIPMPAASKKCIARADSDWGAQYDPHDNSIKGDIYTRLHDNHLYIPRDHLFHKLREHIYEESFGTLLGGMEEMLSDDQLQWLTSETTQIEERIDRLLENNQYDALFTDFDPDRLTRELIESALFEHDDFEIDDALTPAEISDAVSSYEPDGQWERKEKQDFVSTGAAEQRLRSLEEAGYVIQDSDSFGDEVRFIVSRKNSSYIPIREIEDLFELPCFKNMEEHLNENGPTRKDLYNFVRTVLWLERYYEKSDEEIVDEMQDVFSRWSWHDPDVTEYQVKYEYNEGEIDGEPPLPMNCDNPTMQLHCIGQDACPYSIYGALPFVDEMYDHLEGETTTQFDP